MSQAVRRGRGEPIAASDNERYVRFLRPLGLGALLFSGLADWATFTACPLAVRLTDESAGAREYAAAPIVLLGVKLLLVACAALVALGFRWARERELEVAWLLCLLPAAALWFYGAWTNIEFGWR